MNCPKCNNDEFYTIRAGFVMIVDSTGNRKEVVSRDLSPLSNTFSCTQCGAGFADLDTMDGHQLHERMDEAVQFLNSKGEAYNFNCNWFVNPDLSMDAGPFGVIVFLDVCDIEMACAILRVNHGGVLSFNVQTPNLITAFKK